MVACGVTCTDPKNWNFIIWTENIPKLQRILSLQWGYKAKQSFPCSLNPACLTYIGTVMLICAISDPFTFLIPKTVSPQRFHRKQFVIFAACVHVVFINGFQSSVCVWKKLACSHESFVIYSTNITASFSGGMNKGLIVCCDALNSLYIVSQFSVIITWHIAVIIVSLWELLNT